MFHTDQHLISYYIGITIVFASHVYLLSEKKLDNKLVAHGVVNLVAAMLIAYYFLHKEQFIKF
jgi:uncharacterized MnhB-related membrane protein